MDSAYYLSLFLDEGREKLHQVGHALTDLERDPHDAEGIAHVFREIHSFKGNAETMGFTAMAGLAHAMEHVLDGLRNRALEADAAHMRRLHRALLALEGSLADVERGGPEAVPAELQAELEAVGAAYVPAPPTWAMTNGLPVTLPAAPGGLGADARTRRLAITLDAFCMIKGTRALMITTALEMQGAVLAITPSLEELDWPEAPDTFEVLLLTDADPDALRAGLADINEIAKILIHDADPPRAALAPLTLDKATDAKLAAARQAGLATWLIEVQLLPRCPMPAARALLAQQAVAPLGELVLAAPAPEALEACNDAPVAFQLLVASQAPASALHEALIDLAEVLTVSVEPHGEPPIARTVPAVLPIPRPAMTAGRVERSSTGPGGAPAGHGGTPIAELLTDASVRRPAARTMRVASDRYDEVLALAERLNEVNARVARLAAMRDHGTGPLADAAANAAELALELATELAALRRMPIEAVFNRFPRMVRELAHELGKQVSLQVLGPELEVDRSLADELSDLLVHLLRNAVDHGLESPAERHEAGKGAVGTLQLAARREGNTLILTVADDGRGIAPAHLRETAVARGVLKANEAERLDDEAALQLIFDAGFTTAASTTRISGRGVGLDAVKRKAEGLGGRLSVESSPGRGTIFQLRFPVRQEQSPRPDARVGA